MLNMLVEWYKRSFADPDAVTLFLLLLGGFLLIYFLGICWRPAWRP